jgi:hypothetical protein
LNKKPELDVNTAQAAAYFYNCEKRMEDMKLEKNTARIAGSEVVGKGIFSAMNLIRDVLIYMTLVTKPKS